MVTSEEQLRIAEQRQTTVQLTATMDGIVNQLEVFTIGAVTQVESNSCVLCQKIRM